MGTVLEKANKIKETKNKLKEAINDGGGQITNNTVFNNYADEIKNIYIDAISDGVDNLYNNFPKITGEGSEITLDTEEAPINITLEGNTSQKTSVLPEGYTQVDYIEGTGTQYLDFGIALNQDSSFELKLSINQKSSNRMIFGSRSGASSNNISITQGASDLVVDFNNSSYTTYRLSYTSSINTIYIVYDSKEKRIIYDENRNILSQKTNECVDTITTPNTATLFYVNPKPSDTWYNVSAKIYYCKIWDNNILVRDIIPCYRNSDNVVGMYDLITDTFYTNQGTDTFTYGNIVQIPNPNYPQDIKIVTGEQNIEIMNRNLFNPNLIKTSSGTIAVGEDGSIIMTNATSSSNGYYEINKNFGVLCPDLKVGDEVYLYLESDWTSGRRYLWNNDLGQWKNGQKRVLTAGMLNKHLVIYGGYHTTSTLKIMITKNKYYSEFLKYQPKQTYPLSLDNIELAKIGNYKDYIFKNVVGSSYYNADLDLNEWYLHKEIGKVILNGSENWAYESSSTTPTNRTTIRLQNEYISNVYLSNRFVQGSTSSNRLVFSTKNQIPQIYISLDNNLTGIATSDSDNTKLQKEKTYLSENNVLVYFDIIPTNTKITDATLIQQLENINNNAKSYLGTTVIECSATDNTNEAIQASIIALKNINLIESEWSL